LYAGGTAAAASLLPMLENGTYAAQPETFRMEEGLASEYVNFPVEGGTMKAYMARPDDGKKYPGVVVVHEIFGLNPHIEDVTRRLAKEGFIAIAPDALSRDGGTPTDRDQATTKIRALDGPRTTRDYVAATQYLRTNPLSTGKVGCTGFCWGGAMTNQVAVNDPKLNAAVPYYGSAPAAADVPKIKAPILAHYASDDERINAGIPVFEEALKKAGIEYKLYSYPNTKHAFNNDTNPERYNAEAAKLAWERTVAFFKEKLE
jgi:carboxymethylenebutenolidase